MCIIGHVEKIAIPSDYRGDASQAKGVSMDNQQAPPTRAEEIKAFLLLTGVVAPILAIGIVTGYGFFVWMYQLVTGTLPGGA